MNFSALPSKRFLAILIFSVLILSACQNSPTRSTKIKNQDSKLLNLIIDAKEIPGKWSWAFININQPSQANWINQENLLDSSSSNLKGDYWLSGKSYYISILHNIAQYSNSTPVRDTITLHSVFTTDSQEIEPLNVQHYGNNTAIKCFDSEIYYDCTVVVNYQFTESIITVIAPQELEIPELENLLSSILKTNDSKITNAENN